MGEKRVVAMFFSATGTTRKVCREIACRLAEGLGAEQDEYGFTKPARRFEAPTFGRDDIVVFGTPVYAGRVPNVLIDFIRKVRFDGSYVVPVVLFGNRSYDDALKELADTLTAGGACVIGAGAFVGEHAFSDVLAAGRPDEEDTRIADELASLVADKIKSLSEISDCRRTVKDIGESNGDGISKLNVDEKAEIKASIINKIPGEDPIRPYYKPRDSKGNFIDIRKVIPKTNENCDGCGICAEVCPMGSIDPKHVSKITGICIKCCACVKRCPRDAKYFDDKGFLYHKEELEKMYVRRGQSEIFV